MREERGRAGKQMGTQSARGRAVCWRVGRSERKKKGSQSDSKQNWKVNTFVEMTASCFRLSPSKAAGGSASLRSPTSPPVGPAEPSGLT